MAPPDPRSLPEGPDEPENGGTGGTGGDGDSAGEDQAPGGWVPPTERFWRHPSELAASANAASANAASAGLERAETSAFPGRQRARVATTAVLGAAAVVVVGVILLFAVGTDSPNAPNNQAALTQTTGVLTSGTGGIAAVPAVARTATEAIVPLEVATPTGTVVEDGVAVAEGGLVATCADVVAGATSVTMAGVGGRRQKAAVIAVDQASDVALVRVPGDPPVAHFADDATTTPGSGAFEVAVSPHVGRADSVTWKATKVAAVGAGLGAAGSSTMSGLGVASTTTPTVAGELLLSARGDVLGVLDATAMSAGPGAPAYLPADVVLGVASQLAGTGHVRHGWLEVQAADAQGASGAEVVLVDSPGVSTGRLQTGDVITAVDGAPVRSTAELRSRLYVLAPGAPVRLQVQRAAARVEVSVNLGTSP